MQCNQPYYYYTANQNCVHLPPLQTNPHYVDIIGDGDVTTITLPDGTMQSYFVPINRFDRWVPYSTNSCNAGSAPAGTNLNNAAWFVRTILNAPYSVHTFPNSGYYQPTPNNCSDSFTRSYNTSYQGFVQKFHNDGCTSTTDLGYFFPRFRTDWHQGCAAVQVEIPHEKSIFHYGVTCNSPCNCSCNIVNTNADCTNVESTRTNTPMCIDNIKSDNVTQTCCEPGKKKNNQSKSKKHSCACHCRSDVNTSDKLVTTYMDQASSYTNVKGCESQTRRSKDKECVARSPRKGRQRKNRHTSRSACECYSDCCLGSACSDSDDTT